MPFGLKLTKKDTPTELLWNFHDLTGLDNPLDVVTQVLGLDLGADFRKFDWFERDVDQDALSHLRDGRVLMRIVQYAKGMDYPQLRAAVDQLNAWLIDGSDKQIIYQPENEQIGYIDFHSALPLVLLQGQDNDFNVLAGVEPGLEIFIWRRSEVRRDKLLAITNLLIGASLVFHPTGSSSPLGWTHVAGTNTYVNGALRITHGAVTNLERQDVSGLTGGVDYVFSVEARRVSGTGEGTIRLASTADGTPVDSAVINSSEWKRYTVVRQPTTGALRASLRLNTANSTQLEFRNAQLEQASTPSKYRAGVQTVGNDSPTGRVMVVENVGSRRSPAILRMKGLAAGVSGVLVAQYAARLDRSELSHWANGRYFISSGTGPTTRTEITDTAVGTVDTEALGTDCAETTYATNPTVSQGRLRYRWTEAWTADMEFEVRVRVRVTVKGTHWIHAKWVPSADGNALFETDEVKVDQPNDTVPTNYIEKSLGRIKVPKGSTLRIDLWSRRSSGATSRLRWDSIHLIPVGAGRGMVSRLFYPGGGSTVYLGPDLTTPSYKLTADPTWIAGQVIGAEMALDSPNEAAGAGPNVGTVLPSGLYKVSFITRWSRGQSTQTATIQVRVVTVGGAGAGSVVAVTTLPIVSGGLIQGTWNPELTFTADGTSAYQIQMMMTAEAGTVWWGIASVTQKFLPSLLVNEFIRSDPVAGEIRRLGTTEAIVDEFRLSGGGVPLELEPGMNVLYFSIEDPAEGYVEPKSVKSRQVQVYVDPVPKDGA